MSDSFLVGDLAAFKVLPLWAQISETPMLWPLDSHENPVSPPEGMKMLCTALLREDLRGSLQDRPHIVGPNYPPKRPAYGMVAPWNHVHTIQLFGRFQKFRGPTLDTK